MLLMQLKDNYYIFVEQSYHTGEHIVGIYYRKERWTTLDGFKWLTAFECSSGNFVSEALEILEELQCT